MKSNRFKFLILLGGLITLIFVLSSCMSVPSVTSYSVSGQVTYNGNGLAGVTISFSDGLHSVTTNSQGYWSQGGLTGSVTVTPSLSGYTFTPSSITVTGPSNNVNFFASAPNTIYVTNVKDNTVSVINGQTNNVVTTIPVGNGPDAIGVNPTTNMIYVANYTNTVSVINGQTNNVVATIPVGNEPYGIGINPTTNMIYVANLGNNTVSVINGQTNNVVATIPVGNEPWAVGVLY
jgi:YVTN family beta-propeller protein